MNRRSYAPQAFSLVKIATWDRWTIVPNDTFVEKLVDMLRQDGTWNKMVETVLEKHSKSFDENMQKWGTPAPETVGKILDDIADSFNSMVTIIERY